MPPTSDEVAKVSVVFQDPFNLKNLYKLVKYWLEDNGYVEAGTTEKTLEILYSEQVRTGDVREYHIWWRADRQPENQYFKFKIDVDFLGLGIKNVEVVRNDKKYKMQSGEITINIRGILVTEANDKKGRWEDNVILRNVRNWYKDKWYRSKIEEYEDDLYEEVYKLQAAVKDYLELHQFTTPPDLFFEKKGFE
jgi:hypothetical protein